MGALFLAAASRTSMLKHRAGGGSFLRGDTRTYRISRQWPTSNNLRL